MSVKGKGYCVSFVFLSDWCVINSSHSFQPYALKLSNFIPVYGPGHEILVLIPFAATRASMQSH